MKDYQYYKQRKLCTSCHRKDSRTISGKSLCIACNKRQLDYSKTRRLIRAENRETELPALRDFGFLTALTEGLTLCCGETEIPMQKGESFFLPCASPRLSLKGSGKAALSMPGNGEQAR